MKMRPMGDQILLKAKKKDYEYAEVKGVGPGLFTQTGDRIPMTIKVGDTVLLHGRLLKGDNEVEFENEKYVLVRESEIAMVSTK